MKPLSGKRFLLTRRAEQAGGLASLLREQGALVLEVPAIAIEPPADPGPFLGALAGLDRFDWVAFTSTNAVRAVAERLGAVKRWPRLASVGPATSRAIEAALGRTADLEPSADYRAEGLAKALASQRLAGAEILLPLSDRARDTLAAALELAGARVTRVIAYRTVCDAQAAARLQAALQAGIDLVLFASPSAVEAVGAGLGERARGLSAGVIGPVTAEAARAAGFEVRVVAQPSTAEGLVAALLQSFGPAPDSVLTPSC